MTLAERLIRNEKRERAAARKDGIREGRKEGIQEGIQKGRQEGRQEGQRSLLAKLFQLKFGKLDQQTEKRLTEADPAQLQVWAERILTASSMDEIWADA